MRERKPRGGITNLNSARSSGENQKVLDKTEDKSFVQRYKSPTFKTIVPDKGKDANLTDTSRKISIDTTSVWGVKNVYNRDFTTTHKESFLDPETIPHVVIDTKTAAEIHAEGVRDRKSRAAMKKLIDMTTTVYGSTSQMFRAFNKDKKADLSIHELKAYMKRNSRQKDVSDEDLHVLFETIQSNHKGSVPALDFLRRAEQAEFDKGPEEDQILEVRNFLKEKVAERCDEQITHHNPRETEVEQIQKIQAIKDEGDLFKVAMGTRTFDIDVTAAGYEDMMQKTFEDRVNHKIDSKEARYARFLRHGSLDIKRVPFYDMRFGELENLKQKADNLRSEANKAGNMDRLYKLEQTRWKYSDAAAPRPTSAESPMRSTVRPKSSTGVYGTGRPPTAYVSSSLPRIGGPGEETSRPWSARQSPLQGMERRQSLDATQSMSSGLTVDERVGEVHQVHPGPGGAGGYSVVGKYGSNGIANGSVDGRSSSSSLLSNNNHNDHVDCRAARWKAASTRNLATENPTREAVLMDDVDLRDEEIYHKGGTEVSAATSMAAKKAGQHQSTIFLKQGQSLHEAASIQRKLDMEASVASEQSSVFQPHPSGGNNSVSNSTFGQGSSPSRAVYGKVDKSYSQIQMGGAEDESMIDRYTSVNSQAWQPIIYEPCQPPRRDQISDSEAAFRKKEHRRKERCARKKANCDVTDTRLEYEDLNSRIREIRRNEKFVNDHIRYATSTLLEDLQRYKQAPLERMAKKPNLNLSDKMFVGNHEKQTAKVIPDSRDFLTTYSASVGKDSCMFPKDR